MKDYTLYIIIAHDEDGTISEYEHGNLPHARQQFELEAHAELLGYRNGQKVLLDAK